MTRLTVTIFTLLIFGATPLTLAAEIDAKIAQAAALIGTDRLSKDVRDERGLLLVRLAHAVDPTLELPLLTIALLERDVKPEAQDLPVSEQKLLEVMTERGIALSQEEDLARQPQLARYAQLYLRTAEVIDPQDKEVIAGLVKLKVAGLDASLEALLTGAADAAANDREPGDAGDAPFAAAPPRPDHVPAGAVHFHGHWYQAIYEKNINWAAARHRCEKMGGHLATLTTADEDRFVRQLADDWRSLWLGATDVGKEGDWRWITGEKWQYAAWRRGEPNNDHNGSEHFLEMRKDRGDGGAWNDRTVGRAGGFVCEWEAEPWSASKTMAAMRTYWQQDSFERSGSTWRTFPFQSSWWEARAICEAVGGRLPVVRNSALNRYLARKIDGRGVWLGATDFEEEGRWVWIDGERMVWDAWGRGEPSKHGADEDVAALNNEGEWEDLRAAWRRRILCEWPDED